MHIFDRPELKIPGIRNCHESGFTTPLQARDDDCVVECGYPSHKPATNTTNVERVYISTSGRSWIDQRNDQHIAIN